MADKETSFKNLFLLSKSFLAFPLGKNKSGFYRCPRSTALSFANVIISICAVVHISCFHTVPVDTQPISNPLFNTARWMKTLQTVVFILCPLLDVDGLNGIHKTFKSIDDSLHDHVSALGSPNIWQYASIYICSELFIFVAGVLLAQESVFLLALFSWVVLINNIVECQFLVLLDFLEMRFNLLLQLAQSLARLKRPPLMMTIKLSRIHRSMSECLLRTNELFSPQLLVLTTTCFVFVAVECYYLILLAYSEMEDKTIMEFISCVILLVSGVSNFYLIASKAQTITTKAKQFTTVLYQIMQRETSSVLSSNNVLCLHIAWKREVVLTVCGFFNLDLTLVYSMIGAVTTYLAIILQFTEREAGTAT